MNGWKTIFAAALAALTVYLQKMAIPVFILAAVMLLDYVSGIVSAWIRGEISSKVGIIGILKKVGYLVLVAVSMVVDYLLYNGLVKLGVNSEINYFFATVTTVWLILNELISITENCAEIGLPVPEFLRHALEKMKTKIDEEGEDYE